jgi:hypothetical protein
MKPIITGDGELSYRLGDEPVVCSHNGDMTSRRVGDGAGESTEQNKLGPRGPCTKYIYTFINFDYVISSLISAVNVLQLDY